MTIYEAGSLPPTGSCWSHARDDAIYTVVGYGIHIGDKYFNGVMLRTNVGYYYGVGREHFYKEYRPSTKREAKPHKQVTGQKATALDALASKLTHLTNRD